MLSIKSLPPVKYVNKSRYDWSKCIISSKANYHICYSKGATQMKCWNKTKSVNKMLTFKINDIVKPNCLISTNTTVHQKEYIAKRRNFSTSKYKSTSIIKNSPEQQKPRKFRAHSNCTSIHNKGYVEFYKDIVNDYNNNRIRMIILHSLKPKNMDRSEVINKTSVDECISTMNDGSIDNCFW